MRRLSRMLAAVPVVFVVCLASAPRVGAFGQDDTWSSGWGQGVAEAIVTLGPGNQIYVTCNDGGSLFADTSISFMLRGQAPTGERITLTFDNRDPEDVWI